MAPKLIVEQKITAFANQYKIYSANPNGDRGEMLAFAQQKRLAFREKVTFYSDEAKNQEVFSFRAEKALDIHGRFLVEDSKGQKLGEFKKDFKKSLLSSTWHILGSDGTPSITLSESSQILAIVRRIAAVIPIVGDLIEIIVAFLKYHFVLKSTSSNEMLGKYQKTKLFRDHYKLFMKDPGYEQQDWRVLAAMAVALDALQSR